MNDTLRTALSEITEKVDLKQHRSSIEKLRAEFDHSINIVESQYDITKYTCGVHAFGLDGNPTYLQIAASGRGRTFAGKSFINFLTGRNLLEETNEGKRRAGCLVGYFCGGEFRHIGRLISDNRAESKWGTGHLYHHQMLEVPISYGEQLRFFEPVTGTEGLCLFLQYAETKSVQASD